MGTAVDSVSVDFNKLLGYKLIVRAHRTSATHDAATADQPCESAQLGNLEPILRAMIGSKPVFGLRFRDV